jgi:hypothetical protein
MDANAGLKGNLSLLQGSFNSTLAELLSTKQALNLSRASLASLQGEVSTLRLEASVLRLNLSSLAAEGDRLLNTTSFCNRGLESTVSRVLGLEAGLVFVALCLVVENILRPVWIKYRQDLFPLDR